MKFLLPLLAALALAAAPARAAGLHTKGDTPAHVANGEVIDLADYLVPGKTTVFDFSSPYCGPCRAYTEPLANLHRSRDGMAVVTVDINRPGVKRIDWDSPVARAFGLRSIPAFRVYGPDGRLVAEGREARFLVDKWIEGLGR